MSGRLIINAAILLVKRWDQNAPDAIERASLSALVHRYFDIGMEQIECSVEQGRVRRGCGNYLHPRTAERLVECLRLGLSLREAAREAGCGRGTAIRYERLNGPFTCPCGRERKHRGWCSERLKRHPARQQFLRQWFEQSVAAGTRKRAAVKPIIVPENRIIAANWPYLKGKPGDGAELIDAVNAVVPKTFADHQRADICQDLLLAILEGESTIADLKNGTAAAIKRYYKLHPGKFGPVSLDAPIPGTDGMKLIDTIADPATVDP